MSSIPIEAEPELVILPPSNCPFDDCRASRLEQIEQAKLEWEFTANSIPQLLFLLDRDDRVLRVNNTLEQWGLGKVSEVHGRSLHALLHPHCQDAQCRLRNIWGAFAGNTAQDLSTEYQVKDKFLRRYLNLHFRFHRSRFDPDSGFVVVVISDISDIKLAEMKLKNVNDELERRVETSTFALVGANLRLKQEIEKHKRIEDKLEESHTQYTQLMEALGDGLAIFDQSGKITYANQSFCQALGRAQNAVLGHTTQEFIADEHQTAFAQHLHERALGNASSCVTRMAGTNNQNFWVKISPQRFNHNQGETTGSYAVITAAVPPQEEKHTVRDSNSEVDDLYENAPIGYYTLDANGYFIKINSTKSKWLGYAKEEMIGKLRLHDLLSDRSVRQYEAHYPQLIDKGYLHDLELELIRKDGSVMPVVLNAAAIRDAYGKFLMSQASVHDITYRKNAELALRESEHAKMMLAAQVMSAQEKERKRIASELHDGIGQTLSAIKFYVENAINNLNQNTIGSTLTLFSNIVPKLQHAIEEVRRISMDLRPSLLDDIGALATLTWFSRQFQDIYKNIRVELRLDIQENDIPPPLKVAIFRIVQEAMNNCAKYSQASLIHVGLSKPGNEIELTIEDNGRGFDPAEVCTRFNEGSGMGLVSMRERAEFSGGTFTLESAKGKGTSLLVSWPSLETVVPDMVG